MKNIESLEQFEEVKNQEGISVFLFSTSWCPDCLFINPFMPSIEEEFKELNFYHVDRDQFMDLAVSLEVMGIPSFVSYKNGEEISRFVSTLRKTKPEIEAYLNQTIKGR